MTTHCLVSTLYFISFQKANLLSFLSFLSFLVTVNTQFTTHFHRQAKVKLPQIIANRKAVKEMPNSDIILSSLDAQRLHLCSKWLTPEDMNANDDQAEGQDDEAVNEDDVFVSFDVF